jgi:hypothetical protein
MENWPRHELEDILRFYAEAGLDHAVGEEPVNQFAAFKSQNAATPLPLMAPKAEVRPAPTPQRTHTRRCGARCSSRAGAGLRDDCRFD